jgi:N6-L-threonylcarbamoyladenine synthase
VLSNIVSSQVEFHQPYGGVVPEIASRKHLELINPVIDEALKKAGIGFDDLGAVAVTQGPGLIGALLVGMAAAKTIAFTLNLPLVGVNHLSAHIFANVLLDKQIKPPFIALLVSGGHTMLALLGKDRETEVLGQTLDDAAGEAFDKIARHLGLGYPGGPIIDKLAADGDASKVRFPRAMMGRDDYDFSLSGLKTSVLNYIAKEKREGRQIPLNDLAAGFQAAIVDVQVAKTVRAAEAFNAKAIVLAGGVAANTSLRRAMEEAAIRIGVPVYAPPADLCTDNAAMVAALGYEKLKNDDTIDMTAGADANLPLA